MFDTKLEMVLKELSLTEYQTSLDISEYVLLQYRRKMLQVLRKYQLQYRN